MTETPHLPPSPPPDRSPILLVGLAIGVIVILGLTALAQIRLSQIDDRLEQLAVTAQDLERRAAANDVRVGRVEQAVAFLEAEVADALTASASPLDGAAAGSTGLPRFTGQGSDPAVGAVIGEFGGLEYYTDSTATYRATDGVARAVFVWAHWCPFCQQEIPVVSAWQETAAVPGVEIVSITTAIDPSRANPLEPFLDSDRLPYPVIVDADGSLAATFGVNAFPFWVFLGPDGVVLGRHAGLLSDVELDGILRQLAAVDG